VSTEVPQLEPAYVHERTRAYAAGMQASTGLAVGSTVPLRAAAAAPDEAAIAAAMAKLAATPPPNAADVKLLHKTAAAAAAASFAVRGKHEVVLSKQP